HIAASGSLPPGFPATKIGDEFFWDGGLISNTPLEWVLDSRPRRDTLAFQVDLWNARGELPKDMIGVEVRQKEIIYSSRNRAATARYQYIQKLRIAFANLLSNYGHWFCIQNRTSGRARGPVNGILHHTGNAMIIFRRHH